MRKLWVWAAVGTSLSATVALAQGGGLTTPKCQGGGPLSAQQIAQDACQQAYDVFQFLAPQLGIAITGGNATIGQGSVLGGLGHLSVGVRGNVFDGVIPDISKFTESTTGARQQSLPDQGAGARTACSRSAQSGSFKGIPLALTNVGGVDALVSAAYVPSVTSNNGTVTPSTNWQFGWGARVGLLSESIVVPGVSVTWIERDLPDIDISGTPGCTASQGGCSSNGSSLKVNDLKVKTSAWRLVASKSFIVFGLAAGDRQDKYDQSASSIIGSVNQSGFAATATVPGGLPTMTRTNVFGDLSLNLPLLKLVGEIGQVSGGSAPTYNSFAGGDASRSILYGSVGLRLSW